ncbi:MAG TPA: hypothetical protein PLO33_13810 [Kouleothrix sp.]|nr:hypothetical protein [Kouleothrix sp.]HRC76747.1 hypothetical protein [Kouleothrix sp.]
MTLIIGGLAIGIVLGLIGLRILRMGEARQHGGTQGTHFRHHS